MDFSKYQQESRKTAIYPNIGENITYPTLGLGGEGGEICNKVKKIARDQEGVISDANRKDLSKELGDVLWYVAAICSELNISMDDVAEANIAKLNSRKERGTLQGSGDER